MINRRAFLTGCACCAAAGFTAAAQSVALPAPTLTAIAPGVWTHTTWSVVNNAPFAANGLVIEGARKLLLVDTGWTDSDSQRILGLIGAVSRKPMICVGTHAHNDRIGGMGFLNARATPTWTHEMTQEDAPARRLPLARRSWRGASKHFDLGARRVEIFHPGPAHTRDNVVVWDRESRTLFGGCMIRDMSWTSLGNVADANLPAWPASVANLQQRYGARMVRLVPGHGQMGGGELLAHTRALAEAAVASAH